MSGAGTPCYRSFIASHFVDLIGITLGLIGLAVLAVGATIMALRDDALRDATNDTANISDGSRRTDRAFRSGPRHRDVGYRRTLRKSRQRRCHRTASSNRCAAVLRMTLLVERVSQSAADGLHGGDRSRTVASPTRRGSFRFATPMSPSAIILSTHATIHAASSSSATWCATPSATSATSFSKRISGSSGEFLGVVVTGIKLSYFQHI